MTGIQECLETNLLKLIHISVNQRFFYKTLMLHEEVQLRLWGHPLGRLAIDARQLHLGDKSQESFNFIVKGGWCTSNQGNVPIDGMYIFLSWNDSLYCEHVKKEKWAKHRLRRHKATNAKGINRWPSSGPPWMRAWLQQCSDRSLNRSLEKLSPWKGGFIAFGKYSNGKLEGNPFFNILVSYPFKNWRCIVDSFFSGCYQLFYIFWKIWWVFD